MIGLILAIILFNFIAFKTNTRLTKNQIIHIWAFTIALQTNFDVLIEFKYYGYWYFTKAVDIGGLIAHFLIVPPVNMILINTYPFKSKMSKVFLYYFIWEILTLIYELITMLPEPWGYFHYGWWNLWYSIIFNPILFFILILYYKWIRKVEKEVRFK